MAVLVRLFDFTPGTLIQSAQVDSEFNQLVNILSGVSSANDLLMKYNHATDPVLGVDQLGAGAIQRWLQNGTEKSSIRNNGGLRINSTQTLDSTGGIAINNDANNLAGSAIVGVIQTTGTGQQCLRLAQEAASSGGVLALSVTKFDSSVVQNYFRVNTNGEARTASGYPSTMANVPTGTNVSLGGQYQQTLTTAGNVGTGIDDLHSYTIAANTLANDGDSLDFIGGGTISSSGVGTKQLFFTVAGTIVFGTGAFDPAADSEWSMRITVVRIDSDSVIITCMYTDTNGNTVAIGNSTQLNGLTFTNTITMKWQGESSVATDNLVTQNISVVRKFAKGS